MSDQLTPSERVLKVAVSPMFAAILDYCLGNTESRTKPQITALAIMSDGFLMGWNTENPHKEGLMGSASNLDDNLRGVCGAAGLTPEETEGVVREAYTKIEDWRKGTSWAHRG